MTILFEQVLLALDVSWISRTACVVQSDCGDFLSYFGGPTISPSEPYLSKKVFPSERLFYTASFHLVGTFSSHCSSFVVIHAFTLS